MGAFVISKRFNDEYKFEFRSRKGKTILTSTSFVLKFECEDAINLITNRIEECEFIKEKYPKGLLGFKVILNGNLVASSRKYSTEIRLLKGIEEFRKYVSTSEILDFSIDSFVFPNVEF